MGTYIHDENASKLQLPGNKNCSWHSPIIPQVAQPFSWLILVSISSEYPCTVRAPYHASHWGPYEAERSYTLQKMDAQQLINNHIRIIWFQGRSSVYCARYIMNMEWRPATTLSSWRPAAHRRIHRSCLSTMTHVGNALSIIWTELTWPWIHLAAHCKDSCHLGFTWEHGVLVGLEICPCPQSLVFLN